MKMLLWIPAVMAAAMMAVACEKVGGETPGPGPGDDSTTTTEHPVLKLVSESEMSIGQEGGPLSIVYTVENPAEDGDISASAGEAAWVGDIDCSVDGTVSLNVEANDGEDREATVTVTYSWADTSSSVEVTVRQSGQSYDYRVEIASVSGDYWGGQNTISINTEMEYELHLSDAGGTRKYILHMYSTRPENLEAPAPPAGTYRLDTQNLTNQWTISRSLSVFYTTDESSSIRFEEAEVEITKDGDNYTYLAYLTDADGKTHRVTYTGPVALVNQDQTFISTLEYDVELNIDSQDATIKAYYYGAREYEGVSQWAINMYFTDGTPSSWCYQIHLLLPSSNTFADGITPDIYEVNASRTANTVVAGWLSESGGINGAWAYDIYYNADLPRGPMADGTVKIDVDEDGVYTFTVECVDDNAKTPHSITGVISGAPLLMNPFNL